MVSSYHLHLFCSLLFSAIITSQTDQQLIMSASLFTTFVFRLLSGIAGGLLGTVCALAISLVATWGQPATGEIIEPYSLVTILVMVFVGTMASNLLVAILLATFEKTKYSNIRSMLSQVFLFTLALFIFFIPFYLFTTDALLGTAGFHFLASALICALVCEIVSGWKNSLTGLMGIMLAGSFIFGIFALLFKISGGYSMLVIFSLPLAWIFIELGIFLAEIFHHILYGNLFFVSEKTTLNKTNNG